MPIDVEEIKSAFDSFEDENFVDAKSKLADQFKIAKNDYLKNKLGLRGDVIQLPITTNMSTEDEDNLSSIEDLEKIEDTETEKKPKRRSLTRK
jgi:hypothetical protein